MHEHKKRINDRYMTNTNIKNPFCYCCICIDWCSNPKRRKHTQTDKNCACLGRGKREKRTLPLRLYACVCVSECVCLAQMAICHNVCLLSITLETWLHLHCTGNGNKSLLIYNEWYLCEMWNQKHIQSFGCGIQPNGKLLHGILQVA